MSSEIIPALMWSFSSASGGSGSVGCSPGLRWLFGFYPVGSLIAVIWCPMSKNSSYYTARVENQWVQWTIAPVSVCFCYILCVFLPLGLQSEISLHCDIQRHYSQQPLLSVSHPAGIAALSAASSAAAAAATAAHTGGRRTGEKVTSDSGQEAGGG